MAFLIRSVVSKMIEGSCLQKRTSVNWTTNQKIFTEYHQRKLYNEGVFRRFTSGHLRCHEISVLLGGHPAEDAYMLRGRHHR